MVHWFLPPLFVVPPLSKHVGEVELPLAGSRSHGPHGNLLAVPHTCTGPSPTFHGTSSQAHLLATSLTVNSISASFLTYLLEQRVFKRCLLYSCPAISPPQSAKQKTTTGNIHYSGPEGEFGKRNNAPCRVGIFWHTQLKIGTNNYY